MNKKIGIGLFGFGHVGRGFYEILNKEKNCSLEIRKIGIRDASKTRSLPSALFTTSPEEILFNPEIDIVVELIDDANAAFYILQTSLQQKKPVVTANKKMLAENLENIFNLQKKWDTPVLYEGAVCGSIPIIQNLEGYYANDSIESLDGILNGSTNYILTKMTDEKKDFDQALKYAQQLGFAESNPLLDVSGHDSKYKLAIIIAHAFGLFVHPDHILNIGIATISTDEIRYARERGYRIKLIARASRSGDTVTGLVAPQFVPSENSLAHVKDEFNGVQLVGAFTGAQLLTGKGAGSLPTGLAIFSDVVNLLRGYRYPYAKKEAQVNYRFAAGEAANVSVSSKLKSQIKIGDFEHFGGGFQGRGWHCSEGWVSSEKLREWSNQKDLCLILNPGQEIPAGEGKKSKELSLV